jgi:threonine dehydrogenase-like Zn-dependent dehydrogenase
LPSPADLEAKTRQQIEGGRLDPTPFATHHFPLANTVEAYDVFGAAGETDALKVVIQAAPPIPVQPENEVFAFETAIRT